jgi:exodeoxyribonuclease V alpha subunit
MPECLLPPLDGVLGSGPPGRWQSGLREAGLPESLLAPAWALAGLASVRRQDLALVLLAVLAAEAQGHTCLPIDEPEAVAALLRPLRETRLPLEVLDAPELAGLVTTDGGSGLLVRSGGRLASRRMHLSERTLARLVQARAAVAPAPREPDPAILEDPRLLSGEQREAVAHALSRRLALVTGGPGTGKTSVIVAILRGALRLGLAPGDLALAAPTGKAANRMAEAIRSERGRIRTPAAADALLADPALAPQTLHRLIGYLPSGDRPRHHAGNPLKARLVLVDEASMIDVAMLERLVGALAPEACLVLIGDADQLPSVEAGTAFRDLVGALPEQTVRLTRCYRAEGQELLELARRINGLKDRPGSLDEAVDRLFQEPFPIAVRSRLEDLAADGLQLLDPEAGPARTGRRTMEAFLERWLATEVEQADGFRNALARPFRLGAQGWEPGEAERLARLFEELDRTRILCPVRESAGLRGSVPINEHLHRLVRLRRAGGLERDLAFYAGEPVLMTRNDYGRDIFNGDQGLVLLVSRQGGRERLEVVFKAREGFRAFAIEPLLAELELAYAITVHKSQGSEYDRVVLVLPGKDSPLATREILYTAVTRAKRAVTILGSPEEVRGAAACAQRRHSSLGLLLGPSGTALE